MVADRRKRRFERVDEMSFTSACKLMSTLDRDRHCDAETDPHDGRVALESELLMFTKGAPDVPLERCDQELRDGQVVELAKARRAAIRAAIVAMADQALRTFGVAYRPMGDGVASIGVDFEQRLIHLGVVGVVDPPRDEVFGAIEQANRAGIRVITMTGDHPRTAARIGRQLGIGDGLRFLLPERNFFEASGV